MFSSNYHVLKRLNEAKINILNNFTEKTLNVIIYASKLIPGQRSLFLIT